MNDLANDVTIDITDEDIDRALAEAALLPELVRALSARYEPSLDLVILHLDNSHRLVIPREEMQGLENASPAQLAHVEIFSGLDIAWPDLDVDHYLPHLMEGKYATEKWKQAHALVKAAA